MDRFGTITVRREHIHHIINFIASSILLAFLYDHSLLKEFGSDYYKYIMLCISFIMVFVFRRQERKRNILFLLFLICICILSLIINIDYVKISDFLLVISILLFYMLDRTFFDDFTIASIVCFLPFLYIYVRNVIFWHYAPHNHGAIHIAVVGFLLISFMFRKRVGYKTLFVCSGVLMLACIIFGSRTSLISAVIFLFLIYIFYLQQEKGSRRSLYLGIFVTFAVIILVFLYYEEIYSFIFLKWGNTGLNSGGNIAFQRLQSSSRMRMWSEVFSSISIFGYRPGFVKETFGYDNIHNSYIQAYVQYGIVFAIMYCLLIIRTLIMALKCRDSLLIKSYILLLVPMLFFGLFESNFILDPEYQFLGLVFLLVLSQINSIRVSHEEE